MPPLKGMLGNWRRPEFQNLPLIRSGTRVKTYQQFCAELDSFIENWDERRRYIVVEDPDPSSSLLHYAAAWEMHLPICLLPNRWPMDWKNNLHDRIERHVDSYENKEIFYFLPTSGSSGEPKLVAVTRSNWLCFMETALKMFSWPAKTRVAHAFESVFDPFLAMGFLTLEQGCEMHFLPITSRFQIPEFLVREKIEVWASVPSLFLLNRDFEQLRQAPIREVLFTGENLPPSLVFEWQRHSPQTKIWNLFGPVETTVWCAAFQCQGQRDLSVIPIGQAWGDLTLKVNSDGGLLVEGSQVALGYLHTHGFEYFHSRFQTRDLVYLKDGNFYFDGRLDLQVKLLGQRVELELIENLFLKVTGSFGVCVLTPASTLVIAGAMTCNFSEVLEILKEKLPSSHWPKDFVKLTTLPRLASGKVDRKKISVLVADKVGSTKKIGRA